MLHPAVDQLLLGMIYDTPILIQDIDVTLISQADMLAQLLNGIIIQVYKKDAADARAGLIGDASA